MFELTFEARHLVESISSDNPSQLRILSHVVRRMHDRTACPTLTTELVGHVLSSTTLPTPPEQLENLLLWLGDHMGDFGELVSLQPETHTAVIGAGSRDTYRAVTKELLDRGLFETKGHKGSETFGSLTFEGWLAYEQLRRGRSESRKAFMAMPFGNHLLDEIFRKCFRPAVAATGFDLRRLDENPPAGLIDDRLRIEIRTSRFLIADLTGGNQGVYWEAGYAEGLGKPVIYTCEKCHFDEGSTHFNTSHHHTILWEEGDLEKASTSLKTTIRVTLPGEAVMEDYEENEGSS